MFQCQGNHIFKVVSFKRKTMLFTNNIAFPLRVASMRIENHLMGIKLITTKKNYTNLKSPNSDAMIKCFRVALLYMFMI